MPDKPPINPDCPPLATARPCSPTAAQQQLLDCYHNAMVSEECCTLVAGSGTLNTNGQIPAEAAFGKQSIDHRFPAGTLVGKAMHIVYREAAWRGVRSGFDLLWRSFKLWVLLRWRYFFGNYRL